MTDQSTDDDARRCVIVIDRDLPPGRAANAAAVIALTMGRLWPELVGEPLVDASGFAHPGLIPIGIAVLGAEAGELARIRAAALAREVGVVDFPEDGQRTTDYAAFRAAVAATEQAALGYVGVGLHGPRRHVGRIVGRYALLK